MERIIQTETSLALSEIRRLAPILGKDKASRLEMAYLMQDEDGRKRLLEIVDTIKATIFSDEELKTSVLIEPPAREIAENGDFKIGDILYGKRVLYPLHLNKNDLLTHIGVFGSSGCGKTNFIHNLTIQLNKLDVPILIFDFSKRNYRDLLKVPELKDRIKIYTVGRNVSHYRFNPLKPPEGVTITQWAKEFSEVFDHAFTLLGGGRHVILKALGELYKKFSPGYPRISDIKEWFTEYELDRLSSRERNWLSTSKRPIESLNFMDTADVFDCEEGILPSSFFEPGKITILELDVLSTNDKTFFIEIILQWLRDWLVVKNIREKLFGVVILEEAHNVLNREKSKKFGAETVMDVVFREIRELGIGMIYVDQHPSLVSYPALGNTSTHIYMNLGLDTQHSSDIQDASKMLGLRNEDDVDYLRRLPVGHGFILVRKSVFPNPFLIQFPLAPITKGTVFDDEIREVMQNNLAKEIDEQKHNIAKLFRKIEFDDWKLIEAIGSGKGTASDIAKAVRMSGSSFKQNVQKLISLELVDTKQAKVYKQNADVYFLTDSGRLAYKSKFGDFKITQVSNELKNFVISKFTLNGWIGNSTETGIMFEKDGIKIFVCFVDNLGKIIEAIGEHDVYFVCSTEDVKANVIQRVAEYSDSSRNNTTIFTGTFEDIRDDKWKKVEFRI